MGSSDTSDARAVVRRGPARSIRRVGPTSIALLAVSLLAFTSGGSASGGFGAGAGGTGKFASATHLVSDTVGGVTCLSSPNTAAGIATNAANCDAPLTSGPAATSTISMANQGSKATGTAKLTTSDCAVQAFADSSTTGKQPAIVTGGVTYRTAGPPSLAGSVSATFDGTSGHLASARQAYKYSAALSISAWFRTSTPNTMILGATTSQGATAASSFDRSMWLDANGRLVAGVYTGSTFTVTSGATTTVSFADGAWHHVVMTVGQATATTSSFQLYVDGARVGGAIGNISVYPPIVAYDGFWHLGWGYANTWANQPASWFFRGALADVAVFPAELTAAQVGTLRNATTQAAEAAAIAALAPASSWLLQDDASSTYAGAIHSVPPNATRTFRDASGNANTGTAQGTLAQDALGPPTGGGAVAFDGSTGYVSTATQIAGPQSVSIAFWFRTGLPFSASSILGFAAGQYTSVTGYDRMFYLDSSGRLYFAVYPNAYRYLTSPGSFADGVWHFAVGVAAATSTTTGTMKLYVDGQLVAGADNNLTGLTNSQAAQPFQGWWHLGWQATASWPGAGSNLFFKGSLADVAIFDSALTATQVTTLSNQTTRAAYATAVTGGVATAKYFWPLDDVDPSSPPCTYLAYNVSQASRCLLPASTGACATPATRPTGNATLDVPVTDLTATTRRLGTLPSTATGMHAVIPWRIDTTGGGFTSSLVHDRGFVTL